MDPGFVSIASLGYGDARDHGHEEGHDHEEEEHRMMEMEVP